MQLFDQDSIAVAMDQLNDSYIVQLYLPNDRPRGTKRSHVRRLSTLSAPATHARLPLGHALQCHVDSQ